MSEEHPQQRTSSDLAFSFKRADLLFWLSWIEMTVLGGIVSMAILYFLTLVSDVTLPYPWGTYANDVADAVHFVLLASPLFFVSLCQWFLLRRFVARSGLWLVIGGVCGPLFTLIYFMGIPPVGGVQRSWIPDSPDFGFFAIQSTIVGLLVGGLVGGLQALLIERTYQAKRGRVLCWLCTNAIAWGTAFAFGEQMILMLWAYSMYNRTNLNAANVPPIIYALSVGVMCLIIGLITGGALIWLGGNRPSVNVRRGQVPAQPAQ